MSNKPPVAPNHILRACGIRTAGSTYISSDPEYFEANPMSAFVMCPAHPLDPNDIGLTDQGVVIAQRPFTDADPIYDVYDMVGSTQYSVVEFLEEIRHLGLSRKIGNILGPQISLIDHRSRYFLLHKQAMVVNANEIKERLHIAGCPAGNQLHEEDPTMCLGTHYELVPGGDTKSRMHQVALPSTQGPQAQSYGSVEVACKEPGFTPEYETGIIMSMPAQAMMFEIINDPLSDKAQETEKLLESLGSNLPYTIVEE